MEEAEEDVGFVQNAGVEIEGGFAVGREKFLATEIGVEIITFFTCFANVVF